MKPVLTKRCPICSGPMQWCGDVPIEVGTPEEMTTHTCDQLTCPICRINVSFEGIPEDAPTGDDEADFQRHLQKIADKWNGGAA